MRPGHAKAGMAALTFGALGIVFGDIGTSPLYALQTVFTHDNHAVPTTDAAVYGVVSLVFWTITLIVSIKYVTFIMRADNEGEGGIMALIALIRNAPAQRRVAAALLVALGIFGASLFYGDGMITPAISVLSAVEGLKVIDSGLKDLVVPITLTILTALFAIQRLGTHVVGRAFGPVMALWFAVLAVMGLSEVVRHPGILRALSPSYGAEFLFDHGGTAFVALGSVVLTITGAGGPRVRGPRLGRAGSPRRGGSLRGRGPLRPPADPARLVPARVPVADPQLHGPGGADRARPERRPEPVLPARPGVEPDPDGDAGDRRDGDRVAGGHLRRVLGHAPGGPARVPAAADDPPHVGAGDRPGLRAGRQLADLRRRDRARARLPILRAPGVRVRRGGHGDAGDRHAAVLLRRPQPVAQAALAVGDRVPVVPARRPDVLHREPDKDLPRRLVPVDDRAGDLRDPDDVAARALDRHAQPRRGGGAAARVREGAARSRSRARPGDGRVPEREPGDDAAGDARGGRAPERTARERGDRLAPGDQRAARADRGAAGDRRPRLPRRRHPAHHRAPRLPGRDERAEDRPRGGEAGARVRHPARPALLLRLADHDRGVRLAGHGPLAQEALPRPRAQRRQPGRLLRAAGGADRRVRFPYPALDLDVQLRADRAAAAVELRVVRLAAPPPGRVAGSRL